MALHFHRAPIVFSATTLKNLVARYSSYTKIIDYTTVDAETYDHCKTTVALLESGIRQLRDGREYLKELYNEIREEYKQCKTKSDKKDIMLEIEQIEDESKLQPTIAEANELIYMLTARLDETKCAQDSIAVKLGYSTHTTVRSEKSLVDDQALRAGREDDSDRNSASIEVEGEPQPTPPTPTQQPSARPRPCRSIKPPQASLPKFYGKAEEWPEFWAVYKTLVHDCEELEVIEKIILLRECLEGRAKTVIQGIQPLPENYEWLIKTLQETYCDYAANRSQIIQKLAALNPARDSADSCSATYDQINVLVNQMVSAGYDVRNTCDPMWCETILAKFPREIVKPVLIASQGTSNQPIKDLLGHLKKEITAKCYVDNRLSHGVERKQGYGNGSAMHSLGQRHNTRPQSAEECLFCHRGNHNSAACRTVTEPSTRRKTVREGNRCWKCFSAKHNSFDCQKADCPRCGQKHHLTLCNKNEQTISTGQNNSHNPNSRPNNRYAREQNSTRINNNNNQNNRGQQPLRPQRNQNANHNGGPQNNNFYQDQRNFSNNTHMKAENQNVDQISSQLVLMTAEGNLWNFKEQRYEKVLFFFDSGAQKTIIEEKVADQFGLPKWTTEICTMSGIGGHIENFESHIVTAKISSGFGEPLQLKIQTKPVLTNGFPSVRLTNSDVDFLKENNIWLANSRLRGELQTPHVLVGLDYYHELVSGQDYTVTTPSGLHVTRTIFGPTVYGKGLITAEKISSSAYHAITALYEHSEQKMLSKMFELEGLGITEEECHSDDKTHKYLEQYSKKISFANGFITAPFPLKENVALIEDNYGVAIRRLESLQKALQQSPEQRQWYSQIVEKYLEEGTIESFSDPEPDAVGTYYMPHSGVWKPHKKVPLRIVFDASSKRKNKLALNDVIHKGESFINKIHDILISSRTGSILLTCDIEAAFTQIRLINAHKDLCRFLWIKNVHLPPTRDNIIQYRFRRLPFGVTASPSILNMALASYLSNQTSSLAREIASNLYVDNIMMTAATVEEALSKYKQSKELFARIGMNLREYTSNSSQVNVQIPTIDRLESDCLKILGVQYSTAHDAFEVKTNFPFLNKLTKRDIVSQINSIYDPIGLAGPLLVHLKSMMREVFETGVDWKTHLDPALCYRWNRLCGEVNNATITVPRPLSSPEAKMRLWVFADASKMALATCAYGQNIETKNISGLISGKTRLTPKKCRQTIPRLELLALLMAARLSKSIASNLPESIESISVVTDSEIALWWLKSSKKLPIFVANLKERIENVKSAAAARNIPLSFFHVETSYNPADAGTRGLTSQNISDHAWVRGPSWLEGAPNTWPVKSIEFIVDPPLVEEHSESLVQTVPTTEPSEKTLDFIDLSRFSKLQRALRVVALVGKTVKSWVSSTNKNRHSKIELKVVSKFASEDEINSFDIEIAEHIILIQEQSQENLKAVQRRFPDKKVVCDLNGVIRHQSRLQNAALPWDTKSPIYIPPKSELVRLLVRQIHSENAHCGKEHTLTIARQRFWIPRASNAFKKYLKNCVICKKYQGLPLGAPMMPALPKDRVIASKPFENTGCDFMGPFTSKNQDKIYVALYTCLTTRAVHLEVVENMTTGAFLSSFIRFISRRGVPKLMRTDCGSNFKQGEQIIATMFQNDELTGQSLMSYCASQRIKWLFNPPASPWMGGVWERLVASVKKALNKAVGRRKLSFTEMCTTITRIEAILNTRPLTKINSEDITAVPLRPIDFLQGNVKFSLPEGGHNEQADDPSYDPELIQSREQAREAILFSEKLANKFWDCWKSEYLVSLREMQKQQLKQPRHSQRSCPEIGEIVIIEQELLPRGTWPYGKITDIIMSADGLVRSAKILMPNHKTIHRPLNKIYPLEIRSVPDNDTTERTDRARASAPPVNGGSEDPSTTNLRSETRPQRMPLPRASKTRAHEFFRTMDCAVTHTKSSFPMTSSLTFITLMMVMSPALAANAPPISCANGTVYIPPTRGWFEVCIENDCVPSINTTLTTRYVLSISPIEKDAKVRIRTLEESRIVEHTMICDRAEFCEHQYFLSKGLLGNPHCWPVGAIATTAILIYVVIAALMIVAWAIVRVSKRLSNKLPNQATPQRSEQTVPSANACGFELIQLPRSTLSICVILSLASLNSACQHGFMRHSAELVCNENNHCHLEYSRELLFNRLQSELCIEIWHANKSVGLAKFVRKPVEFKCSKVTEFFTRPSKLRVYHAKRCVNAGSCTTKKCDSFNPKETVSELSHTLKYPGYSGCMSSCGGMFCGCFLPLPSCWFYKVAHRPVSDHVFEVIRCSHWTPTVTLDIEITTVNGTSKFTQAFQPYVSEQLRDFNITVASIQKLAGSLEHTQFAVASNNSDRAYVLPPNYQLPVACDTPSQALNDFASCANRIQCNCGNSPLSCRCPDDSFQKLSENPQSRLPLQTPQSKISAEANNIVATSNEEEMVIRIESRMLHNAAELVTSQECEFSHVSEVFGCYDCAIGAHFTAVCKAQTQATITVTCESHQFMVKCGPSNETNNVVLSFDHPVVHEQCHAHCSEKPTRFLLTGSLHYHIEDPRDVSVFERKTHGVPLKHQWFSDITIPSLDPLINVIKTHWKLTLACITTTLGIAALTYLAGPLIILFIAKAGISFLGSLLSRFNTSRLSIKLKQSLSGRRSTNPQ